MDLLRDPFSKRPLFLLPAVPPKMPHRTLFLPLCELGWPFPPSASASFSYRKGFIKRSFTQFSAIDSRNLNFRMLMLFFPTPVSATKLTFETTWKMSNFSACHFSGVRKRVVSQRVVSADVPPERKPERGYVRQNHPFGNRPFISQWPFLVLTKGWFPKGWFRRMFPRNENRNEGTLAKTTLLRNRPLSPSDPFSKRIASHRFEAAKVGGGQTCNN